MLAFPDADTDFTLVHVNPDWFPGLALFLDGYGGHTFRVKPVTLMLGNGHLAPWPYIVNVSPVAKSILGGHLTRASHTPNTQW